MEALELSEAELASRPFSQYDRMPWTFEDEDEMRDFTLDLLRRMSDIPEVGHHLPQGIRVLWNRRSGEYLICNLAEKPTWVGQESAQYERGFEEYTARLVWNDLNSVSVEQFGVDERWQRAVERSTRD